MDNLNYVFPEIFIALAIMFLLVFGVFKKNSSKLVHNLSILFLFITAILIFNNPFDNSIKLFKDNQNISNRISNTNS
jgi:NADH-quinone oxidoreductase subunit N